MKLLIKFLLCISFVISSLILKAETNYTRDISDTRPIRERMLTSFRESPDLIHVNQYLRALGPTEAGWILTMRIHPPPHGSLLNTCADLNCWLRAGMLPPLPSIIIHNC